MIQQFVERIARALVNEPGSVTVDVLERGTAFSVRIYAPIDEIGKLIGKQGRSANAIRTLLGAVAAKKKRRAQLDILES